VNLEDARDADQRREADRSTRDARSAADRLERNRLRLESVSAHRQASLIDNKPATPPPPRDANGVHKLKKGKKDPVYASAQQPASPPKKKSAKSAAKS